MIRLLGMPAGRLLLEAALTALLAKGRAQARAAVQALLEAAQVQVVQVVQVVQAAPAKVALRISMLPICRSAST